MLRKYLLIIGILLLLIAASISSGWAINQLYKQVAGTGNVEYVDEVTVTSLVVVSPTKIQVKLTSNASTQANYSYTVNLYLDGSYTTGQVVTWTAPQIPGAIKTINFSSLNLAAVQSWGVEVIR